MGLDRLVRANLDRDKTLHVFGPDGTIRRVYDRVKSYEYPFFPFQKLVVKVHDVLAGRLRWADLGAPAVALSRRSSSRSLRGRVPVLYRNDDLVVEAAPGRSYSAVPGLRAGGETRRPSRRDPARGWSAPARPLDRPRARLLRDGRGSGRSRGDRWRAILSGHACRSLLQDHQGGRGSPISPTPPGAKHHVRPAQAGTPRQTPVLRLVLRRVPSSARPRLTGT